MSQGSHPTPAREVLFGADGKPAAEVAPNGHSLVPLTPAERLAVEQARKGLVPGSLGECPVLLRALRKEGHEVDGRTSALEVKRMLRENEEPSE